MTLPGDLTTCVLTGTFLDFTGAPLRGTLSLTPSAELVDVTGAVVVPMTERIYQISGQGTITTDPLVSTDNSTVEPQNWTYSVCLSIDGRTATWNILLPYSAEPVDISSITPAVTQGAVTSYATGAALAAETARAEAAEASKLPLAGGTLTGKLTLDGSTPAQIPAGAEAGAVLGSDGSGNAAWTQAPSLTEINFEDPTAETLRGSIQSISGDIWILANAYWDPVGENFYRIDTSNASFGYQIQGQGYIPGEPDLGYYVAGATMWVAQPESYTLIRGGGTSGGEVFSQVGGWELGWTVSQQRQMTIGGGGIEVDGYGTFPYSRVVANTTGSVLSRHIAGMTRNAYTALDGADDTTQESWFWGYTDQWSGSETNIVEYSNHFAVAYMPANTLPTGGVWDEFLTVSAAGVVQVWSDPVSNLGVATKQYVDRTSTSAVSAAYSLRIFAV